MSKKYCYLFTEGNANMRELLGGKGATIGAIYYCCEHRIDILKIYDRFVASKKGSHKLKK